MWPFFVQGNDSLSAFAEREPAPKDGKVCCARCKENAQQGLFV